MSGSPTATNYSARLSAPTTRSVLSWSNATEHTELVNTVKEEQNLAKRKVNASVLTRAKWWLVGMSGEE
ncbi:hypothetical protein [Halalkalicoccus subterraneus]|uniref:hypothetical protein n=1 Tax=Halalkalicoccus subterraneus TaxID=2675002 RepID=UPI000EFB07FC|nr:hypothetical protein [Halalkalicoccus subterraneus]